VSRAGRNWNRLRFQLFEGNPHLFVPFEQSLDELQEIVFRFAQLRKYDVTGHALGQISQLLSEYLQARSGSLRIPNSSFALYAPSDLTFDGVITRQLERLKSQATSAISHSDQDLTKQVAATLLRVSLASVEVQSYFVEHGENPVTSFVSVYLTDVIHRGAAKGLDDVGLEGSHQLAELSRSLIGREFYVTAVGLVEALENVANIALLSRRDVVLQASIRALCDCLLYGCLHGYPGTHVTSRILEGLFRVSRARLDSPLGLGANSIAFSVGPFVTATEPSSFAAVTIALANAIEDHSSTAKWEKLSRLRGMYEELHDRAWLDLADLESEAVAKESFLVHHINSTVRETVRTHYGLLGAPSRIPEDLSRLDSAREFHFREDFLERLRKMIRLETTGIYSRVIPAMFDHRKLNYLNETLEQQCLFGMWAAEHSMIDEALSTIERIYKACARLIDETELKKPYDGPRLAILIAQIGIYAIARKLPAVTDKARSRYFELQDKFKDKYPDLRFAGDFASAKRDLLEDAQSSFRPLFHVHSGQFWSVVGEEHIAQFFARP
jgi:hypothetical protein